jgi:hypothetical protein
LLETAVTDNIYIAFPKDLYDLIVIRSNGQIDPVRLAVTQVEDFIERNRHDPHFWTEEALELFAAEDEADDRARLGDPEKGYQWQKLFLPNGTKLRMTYKGRNAYAQVRHERIVGEDGATYSPSQWAGAVADNTSRNAWRDIWILLPGQRDWVFADKLRRREERLQQMLEEPLFPDDAGEAS